MSISNGSSSYIASYVTFDKIIYFKRMGSDITAEVLPLSSNEKTSHAVSPIILGSSNYPDLRLEVSPTKIRRILKSGCIPVLKGKEIVFVSGGGYQNITNNNYISFDCGKLEQNDERYSKDLNKLLDQLDNIINKKRIEVEDQIADSIDDQESKNVQDPVTLELMKDPVVTNCGHTYERSSIKMQSPCPGCRQKIISIVPNYDFKPFIERARSCRVPPPLKKKKIR